MFKQTAPCIDENSAAKFRLHAHVGREKDNAEQLFEEMFLYMGTNSTSLTLLPIMAT